jgi:hypothetical protein
MHAKKFHFLILCSRLFFYLQATTGGFVEIVNREAGNKIEYHPIVGKKTEREFEYRWDLENPFHNLVSGLDDPPFLSVPDLTENVRKMFACNKKKIMKGFPMIKQFYIYFTCMFQFCKNIIIFSIQIRLILFKYISYPLLDCNFHTGVDDD